MRIKESQREPEYNLSLFALGYESRSIHVPKRVISKSEKSIAIGYVFHNKFSYDVNKKFYKNSKVDYHNIEESKLTKLFNDEILRFISTEEATNVLIDITSMSRHRFTLLIWLLLKQLKKQSILTIKYAVSKFLPPPEHTPPVKMIEPIISDLAGIPGDLNLPTSCIVGLGYEKSKALGAVNYIDPGESWLLIPISSETEFKSHVLKNNKGLLDEVSDQQVIYYNVHKPIALYSDLKSLIIGIKPTKRPMILPLGPKILCAVSAILGYELQPNLPVWRVSSLEQEKPADRVSSGDIISFDIEV